MLLPTIFLHLAFSSTFIIGGQLEPPDVCYDLALSKMDETNIGPIPMPMGLRYIKAEHHVLLFCGNFAFQYQETDNGNYTYLDGVPAISCQEGKLYSNETLIALNATRIRCARKDCELSISQFFHSDLCPPEDRCSPVSSIIPSNGADVLECSDNAPVEMRIASGPWKAYSPIVCSGSKIIDFQTSYEITESKWRCRAHKRCDPADYAVTCDSSEKCQNVYSRRYGRDSRTLTCDRDEEFQLQAIAQWTSGKWVDIISIYCATDSTLPRVLTKDGTYQTGNVYSVRCVQMNIDKFYDESSCNAKETCMSPVDCSPMVCPRSEFDLEVKHGGKWTIVQKVMCNTNKFTVTLMDGSNLGSEPESIRCVTVNTSAYFDDSDCGKEDVCKKPFFGPLTSCEIDFTLQVKSGGNWANVQQVSLNSNKFAVTLIDGAILQSEPEMFRCVKMKSCDPADYDFICDSDEDCHLPQLNITTHSLTCQLDFQLQATARWSNNEWTAIESMSCNAENQIESKLENGSTQVGHLHAIRCVEKSSNISLYIVMGITLLIIFLLVLVLYIMCKLKGNGWPHSIIISKVRRGGGEKDAKSKQEKDNQTAHLRRSCAPNS